MFQKNRALLAFFALIFSISYYPKALAQSDALINSFLKNMQEVDITITRGSNLTTRCGIADSEIRAIAVNRLVPAGLKIVQNSPNVIFIRLVEIQMDSINFCASSLRAEFQAVTAITDRDANTQFAFVPIWNDFLMFTRPISDQRAAINERIILSLDNFLSLWRERNAGASFVRQQPPALPQPAALPDGPNIRTVQQRLQALGHYQGAVDGIAGPGTRQAIQIFQRTQQLPATGDLDRDTMRRLFP